MSTATSSATITPINSASSPPTPKVIIIGAGLSGLAIAHGLRRHDIPFTICEKESTPRDRNWGVTISWAVPFLAKCLPPELFARLQECQPDIRLNNAAEGKESLLIRDGATGQPLIEPSFPGTRRLQIKRTRRIWGEALLEHGGEGVRYGKVLVGIDTPDEGEYKGKVVGRFEDGSCEVGDVLIGTDGGSSFALWLDEKINPSVDVGCHPKKMYSGILILDKPDLERPETWVFYVLSTWPKEEGVTYGKDDDLLEEYRRRMDGWGDPYRKVADWIPEGTKVRPILGGLKVFAPKERWNNRDGRVTIGGDAAHSMTFHRGQGGNNALRDAERFVGAMVEVKEGLRSLKDAVDAYDQDVFERGLNEVDMSSKQTHAFHDYKAFLQSPLMKHGIKPTANLGSS
ncbi:uncharacterized protein AB675_3133 [Cyphellophora attinorum]|uniref:FAD-binding domain-containing protein n=1 Tax=Cyphellophora attinorum TaxID=1664694 RepID=A0A0N1H6P0_9EURO|nr:uncharacterized protein AB675_3133 [Phialophora attinorum]KPI37992.1 hypothetical protein AB675_3133 [Phialophora attinorum]